MRKTLFIILSITIIAYCLPSKVINMTGILQDASYRYVDKDNQIKVLLWDASSAGNVIWDSVYSNITFENGHYDFDMVLTSDTLQFGRDYWYQFLWHTGAAYDSLSRIPLYSSPFAIHSIWADTAGYAPQGKFLTMFVAGTDTTRDTIDIGATISDTMLFKETAWLAMFIANADTDTISINNEDTLVFKTVDTLDLLLFSVAADSIKKIDVVGSHLVFVTTANDSYWAFEDTCACGVDSSKIIENLRWVVVGNDSTLQAKWRWLVDSCGCVIFRDSQDWQALTEGGF